MTENIPNNQNTGFEYARPDVDDVVRQLDFGNEGVPLTQEESEPYLDFAEYEQIVGFDGDAEFKGAELASSIEELKQNSSPLSNDTLNAEEPYIPDGAQESDMTQKENENASAQQEQAEFDVYTPITPTPNIEDSEAYQALKQKRAKTLSKRIAGGLAALVLATTGAFAAYWLNNHQEQETDQPSSEVAIVEQKTFEKTVSATGQIEPGSQTNVEVTLSGTVEEVEVSEGDTVEVGDLLFILNSDELNKAIASAEKEVKDANTTISSAEKALDSAIDAYNKVRSEYDKVFDTEYETQELADEAGQEAIEEISASQKVIDEAEAALTKARAGLETAQKNLEKAKADLDRRYITAPVSGTITAMNVKVGKDITAESNTDTPLITISNMDTMKVSVAVNEIDISQVKKDQVAKIDFSALPDVVVDAVVTHIAPLASGMGEDNLLDDVVSYQVELLVEDPDPQIKPGMSARARIASITIEDALCVPASALNNWDDTASATLEVIGEGGTREVVVDVIAQDNNTCVVTGNITDGDVVAITYSDDSDIF